MKQLALLAIRVYQKFISPHKKFRCAYGVHTGRCGCSGIGYRAIRRFGLVDGLGVLRERLARCSQVHRAHSPFRPALSKQAGVCDLDCGGCDLDFGSAADYASNCISCGDCGNWGDSKKNKKNERSGVFVTSRQATLGVRVADAAHALRRYLTPHQLQRRQRHNFRAVHQLLNTYIFIRLVR